MLSSFDTEFADGQRHDELRAEVRNFLYEAGRAGTFAQHPSGWDRYDPAFSRLIGDRGWIGMTWPRQYGGHERTSLERYIITEELLAQGAPVRAHWLADRQIGPLLLTHGSEAQKMEYLPKIAAGECYFCFGLSEPDSGSDLASIRTRADRVDDGWLINGAKVWTSHAHRAHMMNLLARTSTEESRHAGISQFLVDMKSPGLTIRPIYNMAGEHDFNEVIFENVLLPLDAIIGEVGNGWNQISGELVHERSGSERWIETYSVLTRLIERLGTEPSERQAETIGLLVSRLWTLHRLSLSIAQMLQRGESPAVEAALVKDLGNAFEKEVPEQARRLLGEAGQAEQGLSEYLRRAILYAPSYSIKGGAREILRGIIARGLGLR